MSLVPLLTVALAGEADVMVARQRAREIARLLGFEAQDQTRIAVAVSEIARNAVGYATGGRVEFAAEGGERPGLRVRVVDRGPGIADVGDLLERNGVGRGIAGARRLVDWFKMESAPDSGTVVVLGKALPQEMAPEPAALARIGQALAAPGGADPLSEARLQNLELLQSLAELTFRQEETERLNRELALTNRGVVALYAELDEKAAQLATLNASLELRIAAAVAESERVGEALRQSQKMEAVGQLTGGIAHDFNNLLQIVCGNLELIGRRLSPADERLRRAAEAAMSGAQRAATLTQRLLAFSRRQPLEPKPLDANGLVAGMSELMRRTLGEAVTIETRLAADLWAVEADANQLENALLNLAVNARDAMPPGGRLSISTGNAVVSEATEEAAPGEYAAIAVQDTGCGMSAEVASRVFEPFFTTKEAGKGTGLGLSMVYGFVKQSGGHVRLMSEPGVGTEVVLYLPRYLGEVVEVVAPAEVGAESARPGETILVVEDDPGVRSTTSDVLRELGYAVLAVPDGAGAAAALDGAARIDLVMTDVVLAGAMSGRDVAAHAAAARPGTPVLFASGYARDAIVQGDRLAPGLDFLAKPFSTAALASKVRACLRG